MFHSCWYGGSRDPVSSAGFVVLIEMFLFLWISSFFFVNTAVHPSSHNFPTERRDPDARDGKTWAVLADCGSLIGRVVVWVDCIVSPLGSRTFIDGLVIGATLVKLRLVDG